MVENSKIEWTDHTFNPWIGCQKVSPGCDHCYAETQNAHRKWNGGTWGPGAPRTRTSVAYWKQPLRWNDAAAASGTRAKVFCASLADVFDNQVPREWRDDLWGIIDSCPHLDWLLLTKRPQNVVKMLPADRCLLGAPWPNVWIGTTVENQEEADRRIPHLLDVPAAKRFLSCEPLLGPVDLRHLNVDGEHECDCLRMATMREIWNDAWSPDVTGEPLDESIVAFENDGGIYPPTDTRPPGIDWVICGGESGPNARPMHTDWARSLRGQCQAAEVPFFMKQMGGVVKARMPEIPDDLMIRQFPA